MELKPFTKQAYKRWSDEEVQTLKDLYISGREEGTAHKDLWRDIARKLRRSPTEVQRKLIRMYKDDDKLKQYKQESWSKEKILDQIKQLYLANKPINKSQLPDKLKFTLLKVVAPSAPEHRTFFPSLDHALAEAVLECGYARNDDDGTLDYDSPIATIEDALEYVRLGHKKRHVWTLDEVHDVLAALNAADYPITLPFLTNHYNIYKNAIGVNRKLESFKDVIKKFIDDGSIKSYADLVCTVAPDYMGYYNEDRSRLRLSTEEIRVKKFLDRYKISYIIPRLSDKIATGLDRFANFVPDFIILDSTGNPRAIVEVFGSIGDRENAGVKEIYSDKTKAKLEFYNSLPDIKFIEIYNNGGRCDLDDDSLLSRLTSFVVLSDGRLEKTAKSIKERVNNLKDLIKIQCTNGNWNYDPYMHGMANGLLVALSVFDDQDPQFLDAPEKWLKDNTPDIQELISNSIEGTIRNLDKYGCSISYQKHKKNYKLTTTAGLTLEFDSLVKNPLLTPKNPVLKKIIHRLLERQREDKYYHDQRSPAEQSKDYQPKSQDPYNESNRSVPMRDILS